MRDDKDTPDSGQSEWNHLDNSSEAAAAGRYVTARSTKYWSNGTVPLIAPELLGDVIASASDMAIVITPEGKILSILINDSHPDFQRCKQWEGKELRDVIATDSKPKFARGLADAVAGQSPPRGIELNHVDGTTFEFPVRYTIHPVGPDGTLLMLGRDLRAVAELQQQLVSAHLELERDYERHRQYDARYRVLMDSTSEAMLFIDLTSGTITDANRAAAEALETDRDNLIGKAFANEFESRTGENILDEVNTISRNEVRRVIEMSSRRTQKHLFVAATFFRASGERLMLCHLQATDKDARQQHTLAESLVALYDAGSEAIVFTDPKGFIQSANPSFLKLTEAASMSAIKQRSLADFLSRGSVDLKVVVDNSVRVGQMRMFATQMQSEFGAQVPVEMSVTYLRDPAHPALVFVIRDTSRTSAMRSARSAGVIPAENADSVMELVGSATLKDIVAETTDVVERMCIETAIELTRNNRVAAAEMLGLSRQSLYVKLRKYGMVDKPDAN